MCLYKEQRPRNQKNESLLRCEWVLTNACYIVIWCWILFVNNTFRCPGVLKVFQQTRTFECPVENQFCPRFNFWMNTASFRTVLIHCASLHCSNCHKVVTTQRPYTKLPTKKTKNIYFEIKHGKTFEHQNCKEIWHACAAPGMRSNHLFPTLQSHGTSWSIFFELGYGWTLVLATSRTCICQKIYTQTVSFRVC